MVSALNDKTNASAALKPRARGFVAKSFTDDELRLALLDVMGAKKSTQPPAQAK